MPASRRSSILAVAGAAVAVASTLVGGLVTAHGQSAPTYSAEIRRTAHGTPHILASDFGGLGFGFGYAFAQDDICPMAEDYVTVDAQRSLFFGPSNSYLQEANGVLTNNLDSDAFYQAVIDSGLIERLVSQTGRFALPAGLKQGVAGYVAGYNKYLADVGGPNGISDPSCHGQPWVRPITEGEAYRRFWQLLEFASGDVFIPGIAEATPPPGLGASGASASTVDAARTAAQLQGKLLPVLRGGIGSNAVAIGSAGTRDHSHGMLLGNPHFPWVGTERFYQAQLTIPGTVNVEGSMLFGVPLVLIGHTDNIAWSHTVSTAFRFTPYQLTLVPGSPTTYLVDGAPQQMVPHTVKVQARASDGSVSTVTRTLWRTRDGWVFTSLEGLPFPWTPVEAFAMRDANEDNFRVFNHFWATDMAQSTAQEKQILETYEGIPWVNTIVSDRTGHALYADVGSIPHVTDQQAHQCDTVLGAATFADLGLPVLDGSRSACDWGTDPDSPEPGLFGPENLPKLDRSDYVENSNDSFWLSNPHQPLTGFARIIGDTDTARSLRTRIALIMIDQRVHGTDGLGPAGFTMADMQALEYSDRQYGAELARDATVQMCRSFPAGMAPTDTGLPVAVGDACDVLARWSMREDLDAPGALLWRLYWSTVSSLTVTPWIHPFSSSDPVHTPNTLNILDPQVQTAFGDAVSDLQNAGMPMGATLRTVQGVHRNGTFIPVHGGPGDPNGEFNAIYASWNGKGLDDITEGSSYIQVVTWNGQACPQAATIITYSLSVDPTSPYYADQTQLFSNKQWVPERFCEADIAADPALTVKTVSSGSSAALLQPASVSGQVSAVSIPNTGAGAPAAWAPVTVLMLLGGAGLARRRRLPR
jgi:acyl-homoserine-lactone acylase